MRQEYESIDWDEKRNRIVITKQEYINTGDVAGIEGVREKLKQRLAEIIRQVKALKLEAENIKVLLDKLEGKAGPIGPALEKSQSSPAG